MIETCTRCGAQFPEGRLPACPRCLLEADLPPAVIGGALELQEEIGRGGMGTVYKARHLRLGRTVAVKFLPESLASQPEFQARFEREGRALAMLSHPNIVAVHDFGQEGGQTYLVMEYVEGEPLSKLIPLAVPRAIKIAAQICDALSYAHGKGVVHRDIKPENILIDRDGRAKVSDFGIARIVGPAARGSTVTSTDYVLGTPAYMAPEALAGAPPDPRMDIYSLGAMLYQMVTGRVPAGNFESAPAPLDRIIRKALAPDPAQRYASAEEMRRDLAGTTGVQTTAAGALPSDEMTWLRIVALFQSGATAMALWAFLECTRPKDIPESQMPPLTVGRVTKLSNGLVHTQARFEMWHAMGALAAFAVAMTAYGVLRRHWRLAALERNEPDRPVEESRWLPRVGILALAVYGVRRYLMLLGQQWPVDYAPVIGGPILVAVLFFFWVAVLQAWRRSRPLASEPRIWIGFGLALIPPTLEWIYFLRAAQD